MAAEYGEGEMKKQPLLAIGPHGTVWFFDSCRDADLAGFNRRNIWAVAHGRRKTHNTIRWFYLDRKAHGRNPEDDQ